MGSKPLALAIVMCALAVQSASAAIVVQYTFKDAGVNTYAATTVAEHVTSASQYDTTGTGKSFELDCFSSTAPAILSFGFNNDPAGFVGSRYYYFSFVIEQDYELSLENITLIYNSDDKSGPVNYDVRYSTDGFASGPGISLGTGGLTQNKLNKAWYDLSANNSGTPITGLTGTVSIRLHAWGGDKSKAAGWRHDNVTVNGTLVHVPVPEPATAGLLAIGGLVALCRRRRA